jgi:hypothetical protein
MEPHHPPKTWSATDRYRCGSPTQSAMNCSSGCNESWRRRCAVHRGVTESSTHSARSSSPSRRHLPDSDAHHQHRRRASAGLLVHPSVGNDTRRQPRDLPGAPRPLRDQQWRATRGRRADDVPAELYRRLSYSPCHNGCEATPYPAVLLTQGEADARVDPMHARKICAVQRPSSSGLPVLLRPQEWA